MIGSNTEQISDRTISHEKKKKKKNRTLSYLVLSAPSFCFFFLLQLFFTSSPSVCLFVVVIVVIVVVDIICFLSFFLRFRYQSDGKTINDDRRYAIIIVQHDTAIDCSYGEEKKKNLLPRT